jgi:hypothetical protein
MSNPLNAIVPSSFDTDSGFIVTATGTAAVLILEPQPAAAATATSPLYFGGCTVIDGTISTTESVARDLQVWKGKNITTVGGSTGTVTTTTSTIVRASGSFITDGWRVGELVMTFAPNAGAANAAQDGVVGTITTVAALTLTVSGTPFAALTLLTGTRIARVRRVFVTTIPIGAGTTAAAANVKLINNSNDSSISIGDRKLGQNDFLAVASLTALTASTVTSVEALYARY